MKFNVILTKSFSRDVKLLVKKYPSLSKEILNLIESLKINPIQGESIGNNCYKIRIAIPEKNKGKSGEARVINLVIFKYKKIYPLVIYDKSEMENLPHIVLKQLINSVKNNKTNT